MTYDVCNLRSARVRSILQEEQDVLSQGGAEDWSIFVHLFDVNL